MPFEFLERRADLVPPPPAPARGPPTDWDEIVQAHDDRAVFQALPDEMPAIDIRGLGALPNARQQQNRQGAGLAEGLLRDTRKRHLRQESRSFGCRLLGHKRRAFTQDPSRASLEPLIALYGRDRDRMKVEVEILERQLQCRLAHLATPDDALVRKVILKNVRRILAIHSTLALAMAARLWLSGSA